MKVKKNDKVLVLTGKYKGKTGPVMRTYKKTKRITVEGVNKEVDDNFMTQEAL